MNLPTIEEIAEQINATTDRLNFWNKQFQEVLAERKRKDEEASKALLTAVFNGIHQKEKEAGKPTVVTLEYKEVPAYGIGQVVPEHMVAAVIADYDAAEAFILHRDLKSEDFDKAASWFKKAQNNMARLPRRRTYYESK